MIRTQTQTEALSERGLSNHGKNGLSLLFLLVRKDGKALACHGCVQRNKGMADDDGHNEALRLLAGTGSNHTSFLLLLWSVLMSCLLFSCFDLHSPMKLHGTRYYTSIHYLPNETDQTKLVLLLTRIYRSRLKHTKPNLITKDYRNELFLPYLDLIAETTLPTTKI